MIFIGNVLCVNYDIYWKCDCQKSSNKQPISYEFEEHNDFHPEIKTNNQKNQTRKKTKKLE